MTVNEQFKQALVLLNYTDADGNVSVEPELNKRAVPIVNQIYADLCGVIGDKKFVPIAGATQDIPLPENVLANVMPYGVAMLIAQTAGDADNQSVYASIYNQRRSSARTAYDRIVTRDPVILL